MKKKYKKRFFSSFFVKYDFGFNSKEIEYAIIVTKKVSKRAVVRNRLKRIIKEFLRTNNFKKGRYFFVVNKNAFRGKDSLIKEEEKLKKELLKFKKEITNKYKKVKK